MISLRLAPRPMLATRRNIAQSARSILLGALALIVSTAASAHDPVNNVVAHVQDMLQAVYENPGATDPQKARLATLAQQASSDLAPIQDRMRKNHAQMFSLLMAESIDRNAVEATRAAQMSATEQESRRSTQFIVDVAETLTPAQRKAIVERMSQPHGH